MRRNGRVRRASVRVLLAAVALGGASLPPAPGWAPRAGHPPSGLALAQVRTPAPPSGPTRFRYDEASGRCLDGEGREGYNPGSRDALVDTRDAECADFGGRQENLTYLHLERANLRGANLASVLFYLGSITDSDLTGADLSGTSGQMDYGGSRLRRARLRGADLAWSDLRGTDLHEADLRDARFSRHTRLPFDHDEALRRGMVYVPGP